MKRRLKSNIKYPFTTARGDFARSRGFENPYDMRNAKRVRFEDSGRDGDPVLASSRECEAIKPSKCGAPKTSEYAYFKNIKCGTDRDRSRAQREENDQKDSKINFLVRETSSASDKLKPSTQDLNFSISGERAGPSDHNPFHSPRVSKYDESHQIRSKELTIQIKKRSPLLSENVTPVGHSLFSSPLNKASEAENQCNGKGIFSAKRQRLREWAHSSHSEVEKLHLKGFDLVPLLLSRLFPKGNENNDSPKGDTVNSSKSLTVSKSNDLENRLDDSSKGDAVNSCKSLTVSKSIDLENRLDVPRRRDSDNDLPKACSGRWRDNVLTERDKFIFEFPSNYRKENHLLDEFIDPEKRSKNHEYRSSHSRLGFPFCLPFESYRSSGSSHLNDLDEFGSIIEHQREPNKFLLEWDNEFGQDRLNSFIVNHGIEKNMFTRLNNSWNADQWRIVDNVLDANMCSSSLSSAYYQESNKVPNFSSNCCLMPDFGPAFDDVKCVMGEPGQFPLALPYAPKCITLGEEKNGENVLSNSNIISSYRDDDWLNMKVWDGKPLSNFWWKCISAPDDYPSVFHPPQFPENDNRFFSVSRLKEAPVEEPFSPLYEGVFNRYFLSPISQSSLNTFVNRPLLLDYVSEDFPDRGLCFDDYGDELGYRRLL